MDPSSRHVNSCSRLTEKSLAEGFLKILETKELFTWREEDPSTRKILEGGSS